MTRRPTVALLARESAFRRGAAAYLGLLGYDVHPVDAPWRSTAGEGADVLIVEVDESTDGFDVVRRCRDATSAALVALSPSQDPADRSILLEIGVDDVVTTPVDLQELAARVGGILDRRGVGRRDLVRLEGATVDLASSRLLRPGRSPERLSPGEVALVRAFARNPNRVLTRDELLDAAAADSHDANDRSIDNRVARLRRKLGSDAIATVRGHGYMFVPPFDGPPNRPKGEGHPNLTRRRVE